MSFWRRLILSICLLLLLGVLLSATYRDSAPFIPAQADAVPGAPVSPELPEENTG
jgi:hypothetical protein